MKKTNKISLLLIAGLLISGIFYIFYVKSKVSSIHALRSSLREIVLNVSDTEGQRSVQDIEFAELFPVKSDMARFIEDLYLISKKHEIKNLYFEQKERELLDTATGNIMKAMPASGKKPNVIYSYPVKVNFHSGFRGQAEFIREIQNMKRLVTIKTLKVRRDEGLLATEMVVNIYSMEAR